MYYPTAAERLQCKIERIVEKYKDDVDGADKEIDESLDPQEVLTMGLLPINSLCRGRILGAFIRVGKRKSLAKAQNQKLKAAKSDMVAVEVPGGGKCKITVFMTREQAAREIGSR